MIRYFKGLILVLVVKTMLSHVCSLLGQQGQSIYRPPPSAWCDWQSLKMAATLIVESKNDSNKWDFKDHLNSPPSQIIGLKAIFLIIKVIQFIFSSDSFFQRIVFFPCSVL